MNIFKLILLYQIINRYPIGPIAKSVTPVTRKKLISTRIASACMFVLLKMLMFRRDTVSAVAPISAYGYYGRSNTITHNPGIEQYLQDICNTIPDWNIFTKLRNSLDIHETCVMGVYNPKSEKFENLNDTFLNTARLACGVGRLYSITKNKLYLEYYTKLLDGVNRMLKHTTYQHRVMEYPDDLAGAPTTVMDLNAIAHLISLISEFNHKKDTHTGHLEECVRDKLSAIMDYSDYILVSDNIPVEMTDLAPNTIYNNTKCFIYIGIRMCQELLTRSDICILIAYLKIRPTRRSIEKNACLQDIITCAVVLESILTMHHNNQPTIMTSTHEYTELTELCIGWLEYFSLDVENGNPEIESILARMYSRLGNNVIACNKAKDVASILNVLYDKYILRKTFDNRASYINQLDKNNRFGDNIAKLPLQRSNISYYWTTLATSCEVNDREYPVFEYISVYSRIYELLVPLK